MVNTGVAVAGGLGALLLLTPLATFFLAASAQKRKKPRKDGEKAERKPDGKKSDDKALSVGASAAAAAPTNATAAAPAAAVATGGNAILARLKQQRAAPPAPAPAAAAVGAKPSLTFAFASQTGTGAEIARNLAAEAVEKGYKAQCMSLTELGYAALTSGRTPYLVIVASSTGDGDPPDNGGAFFVALRKKQEGKPLVGVKFTLLGLGDSNYTRFMYVPRAIKGRLLELGATEFYSCAEADEVEGIESVVDPWSEGLWAALEAEALAAATQQQAPVPLAAPATSESSAVAPASAPASTTAGSAPAPTGGNAILARLRQQRAAPADASTAQAPMAPPAADATSAAPAAAVADAGVVVKVATSVAPTAKQEPAPSASAAAAPAAAVATGGNAILARLKQQRAAPPAPAPAAAAVGAKPPLTFAFASQTGTGAEIARNLAAEAVEKGYKAQCMSLTELGYAALTSGRTPYLVIVASSTGDGDPPDNSGAFFVALRKKQEGKPLVGVKFTLLGLGDSNYTRFMYVPRAIKGRLLELGATEFYSCAEADEVEGIESVVDPWSEGLWAALEADIAPPKDQAAEQPPVAVMTAPSGPSRKSVEMMRGMSRTPVPAASAMPSKPSTPGPQTPVAATAPTLVDAPSRSLVPETSANGAVPKVEVGVAPVPATGGAALLAKMRSGGQQHTDTAVTTAPETAAKQQDAAAKPAQPPAEPAKPPVVAFTYGSQTGTGEEIARNLAAEAIQKGYKATCAPLNELGYAALTSGRTPVLVVIASSTGDGDPPDNAANFFVALRKKQEGKPLAGVKFTLLGLGDSNYTTFMGAPRAIKSKLAELGATEFHPCAEADEVDGIESVVDPWSEGLWAALKAATAVDQDAVAAVSIDGPAATAAVKPVAAKAGPSASEIAAAAAAAATAAEAAAKAAVEKEAAEKAAKEAAEKAAKEAAEKEAAEKAAKEAAAAAEKAAKEAAEKAAKEAAEKEAAEQAAREAVEKEAAEKAAKEAAEKAAKEAAEKAAAEKEAAEKAAKEAAEKAAAEAATRAAADATTAEEAAAAATNSAAAEAEELAEAEASAEALAAAAAHQHERPSSTATSDDGGSLLPSALLSVMEAGTASGANDHGLPTIKESRVFEEEPEPEAKEAAKGKGLAVLPESAGTEGGEDPLLSPRETEDGGDDMLLTPRGSVRGGGGRPDSRGSVASSTATGATGTWRRSVDLKSKTHLVAEAARRRSLEKPARLQAKPLNVNFPSREETVVKRKDEKAYGLLLGLAPVGVDTKGAPALLPCRLRLLWEKDEKRTDNILTKELLRPTREERHKLDPQGMYSPQQPFWAHISDARYETAFWSDRKVLHLELSIRGSNIAYSPGDAIGVLPTNHPDLVTNLCKRLNLNPDRVFYIAAPKDTSQGGAAPAEDLVSESGDAAPATPAGRPATHIPSPCSIGYAFTNCVDLTSPARKSLLRLLAEHAHDASEKRTLLFLSAKGGKDAYAHEIAEHQPSVLDLLVRFPSVTPPLDALLDALPPLAPRMYSITSSRKDSAKGPNRLSVALSVVRFKTRYGTRLGVASAWLDRLASPWTTEGISNPTNPVWVPIFLRRSADFKPPADLASPLIMVGPGTGVAPFRGFLQERRALIRETKPECVGEAVLFFGCRREDEDYIFKEELELMKAEGTLSALHVAFSRAQEAKVYVQDLIKAQGEKVWGLLQAGGYLYVCGDGAAMAKDVHAALLGVAVTHGGLSEADAAAYLQNLTQERRYVRDVWS
ncbi:hypothetical protein HYH02_003922 [Chlamydomonas schloesseri]|uniref:Methionine synthase reductase n=1 Tax=Chlamydomonas schloesseri TaxID=2026947 RepID=A0A835WPP0_9CHLO|nr:hypothetical protein HYH02_003922 [Chlamydomonas schloesseri]|eukprot:KAG2451316.1 hypothetical protein HYH02_003922 [Chlamydomonas schloesseri]